MSRIFSRGVSKQILKMKNIAEIDPFVCVTGCEFVTPKEYILQQQQQHNELKIYIKTTIYFYFDLANE